MAVFLYSKKKNEFSFLGLNQVKVKSAHDFSCFNMILNNTVLMAHLCTS